MMRKNAVYVLLVILILLMTKIKLASVQSVKMQIVRIVKMLHTQMNAQSAFQVIHVPLVCDANNILMYVLQMHLKLGLLCYLNSFACIQNFQPRPEFEIELFEDFCSD